MKKKDVIIDYDFLIWLFILFPRISIEFDDNNNDDDGKNRNDRIHLAAHLWWVSTQIKIPISNENQLKIKSNLYFFVRVSIEICGGTDHARARNFNAHMEIY